MSSPPSDSERAASSSFDRLAPEVQRWVHRREWQALRDIQEAAIPPILDRAGDLIVAAATATGKTEAAFLPVLSNLAANPVDGGLGALYVSPLKALINDQHQRLDQLCEATETELQSWHGDISADRKKRVRERPRGVLLITPESLEAIFVNHGSSASRLFGSLRYIVIDELHAFIGSERGRQLQSLLHRIELAGRQRPMRIGLSATLGDLDVAARYLRPGGGAGVKVVESGRDGRELRVQLRGHVASAPEHTPAGPDGDGQQVERDRVEIAAHLFENLRGVDNLVFANSRQSVEEFADLLRRRCEEHRVPSEFWPHHGNLSKALREDVESKLRESATPTTAICTSTLELGIDVGSVESVAQIDPPFSAAALRQRLGRCGRRPSDPSVLRMYVTESDLEPGAAPTDQLREGLVQSVALVEALVDSWVEPPVDSALHLSTLVQQVLSVIAQHGGARADQIWSALCGSGPFELDRESFVLLLRGLAEHDVIQQVGDGDLILGLRGEQIVGHYSFYSAFVTSEEYRLIADGEELGSMPVRATLAEGAYLIFGGRRWQVTAVDDERKVISVVRAKAGKVPRFFGGYVEVHDGIRRRMRRIYESTETPRFLDREALELLRQGRAAFAELGLGHREIIPFEGGAAYFPWRGDRVLGTLALGLRSQGLDVEAEGLMLTAPDAEPEQLREALRAAFGPGSSPDPVRLAGGVENLEIEKHHRLVHPELLVRDCATSRLDIDGARESAAALSGTATRASAPDNRGQLEFVVVDCETTGLHPSTHHRIVELAMVTLDEDGSELDRWATLIRPGRDLGATEIHGIRARELSDAPSFDEILGEVTSRLAGRVMVAHNVRFDRAFLEAELERCGLDVAPLPTLCTMTLASRLGVGGARRKLDDCRASLGIDTQNAHHALDDCEAAAAILAHYLSRHGSGVRSLIEGSPRPSQSWPPRDSPADAKPRSLSEGPRPSPLANLMAQSELVEEGAGEDVVAYLEILDRAIEDRKLDREECEELVATAGLLGLGKLQLDQIHRDYLGRLLDLAWRDGEVTDREREDLALVAAALGVPGPASGPAGPEQAQPAPGRSDDLAGKTVCFTGTLTATHGGETITRAHAIELAEGAGLVALPRVTKKLDILVVADPDTMSGKARQARKYGTRVIAEAAFWEMIGVEVG